MKQKTKKTKKKRQNKMNGMKSQGEKKKIFFSPIFSDYKTILYQI